MKSITNSQLKKKKSFTARRDKAKPLQKRNEINNWRNSKLCHCQNDQLTNRIAIIFANDTFWESIANFWLFKINSFRAISINIYHIYIYTIHSNERFWFSNHLFVFFSPFFVLRNIQNKLLFAYTRETGQKEKWRSLLLSSRIG